MEEKKEKMTFEEYKAKYTKPENKPIAIGATIKAASMLARRGCLSRSITHAVRHNTKLQSSHVYQIFDVKFIPTSLPRAICLWLVISPPVLPVRLSSQLNVNAFSVISRTAYIPISTNIYNKQNLIAYLYSRFTHHSLLSVCQNILLICVRNQSAVSSELKLATL